MTWGQMQSMYCQRKLCSVYGLLAAPLNPWLQSGANWFVREAAYGWAVICGKLISRRPVVQLRNKDNFCHIAQSWLRLNFGPIFHPSKFILPHPCGKEPTENVWKVGCISNVQTTPHHFPNILYRLFPTRMRQNFDKEQLCTEIQMRLTSWQPWRVLCCFVSELA